MLEVPWLRVEALVWWAGSLGPWYPVFSPAKTHLGSIMRVWKSSAGRVENWGELLDSVTSSFFSSFFYLSWVLFFLIGSHFLHPDKCYTIAMWALQNAKSGCKNVAKWHSEQLFSHMTQHHFTIQISATSLVTLSADGKYFTLYFNAFSSP